nr:sugar ABC transporter ATP-binding protein [Propionivibrio sp.]
GRILFHDREIASAAALRTGFEQPIAFIHQDLGLIDWMTVAENMAFTMGFPRRFGLVDWKAVRSRAQTALREVGIDLDPDARVFELSRTEKALLAIARAVAVEAEVLVLDEPTASLPADDVHHLFEVLNKLRTKQVGMIYVTHRLDEVIEIADEICVMRDGFHIAGGATAQYTMRDLVHLIVGEEKRSDMRLPLPSAPAPVLSLDGVRIGDTGPVTFRLHRGEMVALAGLRGAGQEEIGRALFGMRTVDAGRVELLGSALNVSSPMQAIAAGISLVAGDRLGESVVPTMSVRENLFINPFNIGKALLAPYLASEEVPAALRQAETFDIRPRHTEVPVSALSGGNQQKVVIARWMNIETPVLVLEDPTAGVDVGARAEIYALLNQALERGVAVLVISTDFEEIAHICNRALVFNRGRVSGELLNEQVTFANLLHLACADEVPGKASSDINPLATA